MGSKPSVSKSSKNLQNDNTQNSGNAQKKDPNTPKDVMISYSHADKEMMNMLRDNLEASGISVWVDVAGLGAGVDFLGKIGQAILDAKVFISLLSTNTVKSKYCQDEVALATISDKPIFVAAMQTQQDIYSEIGNGMKLQLAGIEWDFFMDKEKFNEDFAKFLPKLEAEVKLQESGDSEKEMKKQMSRQESMSTEKQDPVLIENPNKFWEKLYKDLDIVEWDKFEADVKKEFATQLSDLYRKSDDEEWLFTNLKREMEVDPEDKLLHRPNYLKFCKADTDKVKTLWLSIKGFVKEMYAIQMVFDMGSSVRVDAIERLGKFQSPKVIESLRDLLFDKSANIRAVAAVSLSKTGNRDKLTIKQLMKCLNDKDRLVREAGCLSLGNIQAAEAVPQLLRLWRNDFISHVREAALVALNQIGGEEVNNAIHITKVLAEEIRLLTDES